MSENRESNHFFAVSYGTQRGVFGTYKEAQSAMKGFPQPVYKKFSNREEAEQFLEKSHPESTSFEANENDTDGKFYAVARGRVIGIFKDLETVKKNIAGFPKPMHKKFNTFAEAKNYVEKFAEGKEEKKTPRKRTHLAEEGDDGQGVKPVARKRTSGKVGETDESDGAEHMDQTQPLDETEGTTQDSNNTVGETSKAGKELEGTSDALENGNEAKKEEPNAQEGSANGDEAKEPAEKQAKVE